MSAGLPRRLQHVRGRLSGEIAIEQRRAKRAIGIGADKSGKGNIVGAPERNHRHEADQS